MVRYYNQNDNINIYNKLDTYKKGQGQEQVKMYRYCWKCLGDFDKPSVMPFCDQRCMNEYYHEIARENDACYREWIGMD